MDASGAPTLPLPALALAALFLLAGVGRALRGEPTSSGKFLITVIWLRIMMQAFHPYTYQTVGGLSINAIASLGVCMIGFLLFLPRLAALTRLWSALLVCLVVAISGALNGIILPTVETLLKWGYFFFVFLALRQAIDESRDTAVLRRLIWAVLPVIVYQVLSVALGIAKSGEADGSASFIGGFNHEAVFSILLVTSFFVISIAPRMPFALRGALLAYCIVGLFLGNYRTSILALLPIAAGYVVFAFPAEFKRGQQTFPWMMISVGGLLAALAVGDYASTRMVDLQIIASSDLPLIRAPSEFTQAEGDLFSGRWQLWNLYYDAYLQGTDLELLFGSGPDAWESFSEIYAHNTIVSYLYEFGLFGALAVVVFWLHMVMLSLKTWPSTLRWQLVFCHLGFIVLNFATMPMWAIEGLIFYGLLCGISVAAERSNAESTFGGASPANEGLTAATARFPQRSRRLYRSSSTR